MRRNNPPRGHGGPLMTEHLQLQDLDLELELLKRKREMIEQQQQMLSNNKPFNRPRPFEIGNSQPRPLLQEQHQPFHNANFSRFYNDAPQPLGFGSGPVKRHSNDPPVWQAHSAPKRFSGPQSGPKKKFGAGPGPKFPNSNTRQQAPNAPSYSGSQFNQPQRQQWDNKPKPAGPPKSTFPSQRFNNAKGPKPQQRDFRPNKVTKSKPPPKVNKPAPNPTPDRKKFTPPAAKSSKDDDFTGDEYILRADTVPTTQMAGRLELVLGNILKEIKAKYGNVEPHAASFLSPFLNRRMKQAIRERLRAAMLGKPVGKVTAIVEHYRRVFPPETDTEILEVALNAQKNMNTKLAVKLEGADTAYKYLTVNMNKLIGVTLDDMFEKLQKMYAETDKEDTKEICEKIISDCAELGKDAEPVEADKNVSANGDESSVKAAPAAEDDGTAAKNSETEVANGETVDNVEESSGNIEEIQEADEKQAKETPLDEDKQKTEELSVNDEKPADGTTSPKKYKNYIDFQKPEWKKVDKMITTLIERRLTYILPKFRPQLFKVLNAAGSYRVTKTAIIDKTQDLINLGNRIERAEKGLDSTIDLSQSEGAAQSTPKRNQTNRFSYMVKILGRPVLPKRKIMQGFLDEYKPTSVKKHRNMHMLFVSFAEKEAYERIVAVKETELGNCTISIKATEKTIAKQNESLNNSAINDSPEKLIGSDLDDQINDLLTSIRNEEESGLFDTESNDVEIVPEDAGEPALNEENSAETENVAEGMENTEADEQETTENAGNGETAENQVSKDETVVIEDDKVGNEEAKDKVEAMKTDAKETGRATPTRASSRLTNVTPSTVRTRRASRLAQN